MSEKRTGQTLVKFLGVNLRQDATSLADEDLVKAINADLHTIPGVIARRPALRRLYSTALADTILYRQAVINANRYQAARTGGGTTGTWYRNGTSIVTGLDDEFVATAVGARPLNSTTLYAFLADSAVMRKDDGTTTSAWGIATPTTVTPGVAAGAAGSLTGSYQVKFTYVRKNGSTVEHESSPSPTSAAQSLASQVLSISGMTASSDAQVTHKRIYRTVAGGAAYLFDQEITNATTTATSSQADALLGTAVEDDNNPPTPASWAVIFNEQAWLARDPSNPHYLWRSKRFRYEAFPATNFMEIGTPDDPLQCLIPLAGLLGALTRRTKYRIVGSEAGGYVSQEALSRRGAAAPAVVATEQGALFVARDGVFLTNFIGADEEISQKIAPLFYGETISSMDPIYWAQPTLFSIAASKGRVYITYPTGGVTGLSTNLMVYSRETKNWYFYGSLNPLALYYDESADHLLVSRFDGLAWIMDEASGLGQFDGYDGTEESAFGMSAQTKSAGGESLTIRKLFLWVRLDIDTAADDVTVLLYVDDVLRRTVTGVVSTRGKALVSFPEKCMGYTWSVRVTYDGKARVKWFGAAAIWEPLEAA